MKGLTVRAIMKAVSGAYSGPDDRLEKEITGVAIDSRLAEIGGLFVPIKGERVDGHNFIPNVMEKGALVTLSEKKLDASIPHILVDSTFQALKDLAEYYLSILHVKVIGVTGSVGKTSTKEMIAAVLKERFKVLKTAGNYNNEIGLPLTVFRLDETIEAAVLEMGISEFGEMSRLAKIAKPDIAVITNIGYCHLENLGDRDGVLRAKTEIFRGLKSGGTVILNGDDDKLAGIREVDGKEPVMYTAESKNGDLYADNIANLGLEGTRCTIHTHKGDIQVMIPVPGIHMVSNALAAAGVGLALGMELEEIRAGIAALEPVNGRLKLIKTKKYTLIDDCYNANPVSMKAAADVLATAKNPEHENTVRTVALFGDMFELGAEEAALHSEVGTHVGKSNIDVLICAGKLCGHMAEACKRADETKEVHYFEAKEDMIKALPTLLREGDMILLKASHGMEYDTVLEQLTNEEV